MQNYYKFIGAIAGNLVGILVVYLATKGLAVCTVIGPDQSCTVFGFSETQITAAVMMVLNSAFVHFFPANTPVPPAQAPKP